MAMGLFRARGSDLGSTSLPASFSSLISNMSSKHPLSDVGECDATSQAQLQLLLPSAECFPLQVGA
eukprot:5579399-Pyramimonas_sp.AAC.1